VVLRGGVILRGGVTVPLVCRTSDLCRIIAAKAALPPFFILGTI
jgi:hypothetical protein